MILQLMISMGHFSAKRVAGVTFLILNTSSDDALYLDQVS